MLVEARTMPRMTMVTNPVRPIVSCSCRMRVERMSVKVELVAVIGLTMAMGPISRER